MSKPGPRPLPRGNVQRSHHPMTFAECVRYCLGDREFVANYDRLRGTNLGLRGSPLELAIDGATGRTASEVEGFVAFVKDAVWDRLPPEVREAPPPRG